MTKGLSGHPALQAPVCGSCCFRRAGKDERSWLSDDVFWSELTPSISAEGHHLLARVERSCSEGTWVSRSLGMHHEGGRAPSWGQTSQLPPPSQRVLAAT